MKKEREKSLTCSGESAGHALDGSGVRTVLELKKRECKGGATCGIMDWFWTSCEINQLVFSIWTHEEGHAAMFFLGASVCTHIVH